MRIADCFINFPSFTLPLLLSNFSPHRSLLFPSSPSLPLSPSSTPLPSIPTLSTLPPSSSSLSPPLYPSTPLPHPHPPLHPYPLPSRTLPSTQRSKQSVRSIKSIFIVYCVCGVQHILLIIHQDQYCTPTTQFPTFHHYQRISTLLNRHHHLHIPTIPFQIYDHFDYRELSLPLYLLTY